MTSAVAQRRTGNSIERPAPSSLADVVELILAWHGVAAGDRNEREARRQWNDPAAARQQLVNVDAAYEAGEISKAERDRLQDELVSRYCRPLERTHDE